MAHQQLRHGLLLRKLCLLPFVAFGLHLGFLFLLVHHPRGLTRDAVAVNLAETSLGGGRVTVMRLGVGGESSGHF